MTITDRNLKPETLLKATYKGASYLANVLETAGPKVEIIEGRTDLVGSQHGSLSRAAIAITGNSVNGWRFWSLAAAPVGKAAQFDSGALENTPLPPAKAPKGRKAAQEPAVTPIDGTAALDNASAADDPGFGSGGAFTADAKRPPKVRIFNPIKRVAQQGGTPEGQTRMWCSACGASFYTTEEPESFKADTATCPNGHNVGQMRDLVRGESPEDVEPQAAPEAEQGW